VCLRGEWQVPGQCLAAGLPTLSVPAVQLRIALGAADPSNAVDVAWGEANEAAILDAAASTLSTEAALLRADFVAAAAVPSGADAGWAGVELRLTLLLAAAPTLEDAQGLLDRLLGTASASASAGRRLAGASGTGFSPVLSAKLKEQGKPVPLALSVSAAAPAQILSGYVIAASNWSAAAWGPCSSRCGEGFVSRLVHCTAGLELLCNPLERPPNSSMCTSEAACGGTTGPTGAWDGLILVYGSAGFVVGLCCCLGLVCGLVRLLRRPRLAGAIVMTSPLGSRLKAKFRVHNPADKGSNEITKDGKCHVVWDLDKAKVPAWFQDWQDDVDEDVCLPVERSKSTVVATTPGSGSGRGGSSSQDDNDEDDDAETILGDDDAAAYGGGGGVGSGCASPVATEAPSVPEVLTAAELEEMIEGVVNLVEEFMESNPTFAKNLRPASRTPIPKSASPHQGYWAMYQDHTRVEYFSHTLSRWVPGTIRVTLCGAQAPFVARYDVQLRDTSQWRVDVPLELLRLPLKSQEAVELFTRRRGGSWLPGNVAALSAKNPTVFGYPVLLGGCRDPLIDVPALRIRRRYAIGDLVWVYGGLAVGWLRGEVDLTADDPDALDGVGHSHVHMHRSSSLLKKKHLELPSAEIARRDRQRLLVKQDIQLFTWLAVSTWSDATADPAAVAGAGAGAGAAVGAKPTECHCEWVPSYLVR